MWAGQDNRLLRFFDLIRGTLRYKLLVLVLFPILLVMPIALITAVNWSKNYGYEQLFIKVKTDLSVSHDIFERIQQDYLNKLVSLAESYTFRSALEADNRQGYNQQVTQLREDAGFSFLKVLPINGSETPVLKTQRNSVALLSALQGKPSAGIEIYSMQELQHESPALAKRVHLPLVETPRARPSDKSIEDRGMVIRTLYPIKNASHQVIALVDGGVLLNGNFDFVDAIRDLVYAKGNLPEGSIGTVTVFLDDVRINTNVPLNVGERALGTRASNEVRTQVLDNGDDWIDRAFVVNDWYISSYEAISDVDGKRVGMLYAGFLEAPFRTKLWQALWVLILMFLGLMLLSAWVAFIGAKSIFRPIETMSEVIEATQKGQPERVGAVASKDEIGVLAKELDAMLDLLEHREQEIQNSADQLENKVIKRTAELQRKNDDLRRTIQLLRETRQQLVIAEKLAALGELTAGVAHEINNPIAVILGSLDIITSELGKAAEPVKEEIDIAIQQVYRIKDIINNLLQYARPDEYAGYLGVININELIEDSLKLVKHLQKDNNFTITLDLQATEFVEINAQECQQVIVNLIVNAIHALPEAESGNAQKGQIIIRTRNWNNKGVMLGVKDNGSGIPKDKQGQIFNPFYSTKSPGKGTGLGLSVSYSLIRRYGGNITVESEEGKGAEFGVWILAEPKIMEDEETIAEQLQGIEDESKRID
ncbi:MAG: Signal transduction histidine kinase [uncultured Thiotrichaceae bacterium]|uniref:histidine kinase n=1 Tax=uncultured Thiotrichaceae bacterium TaxID=298394 RepID=A0A6S6TYI6_9GAMM|nr:MAG: Signal transduction histidine kinase [uncultured Thiotrichaceae bacterium]